MGWIENRFPHCSDLACVNYPDSALTQFGGGNSLINISGWQSKAASFYGHADILTMTVFNRGLTSADFK